MKIDDVLYLKPDVPDQSVDLSVVPHDIKPSDPAIMIPGIDDTGTFYPVEKIEAHVKGLHHLALSIFIFDGDELLIQRRAFNKYHCGGQWANTCCTHPHFGEDICTAAHRRLKEEIGFTVPLTEKRIIEYSADVGGGLWEREQVHMFHASVRKSDIKIELNPEEVCDTKWVTAEELHQRMTETPDDFTPWFRIYLKHFPELNF